MKRTIGWIVVLLGVIGASVGGWFIYASATAAPLKKYETTPVDRGRIIAKVTATGTLSAIVTVQVGSQVSGRLKEINVDFNSKVKKGEVLAKIDPQLFDAAVEQARANWLAADGNLLKAKAQAVDAHRQYERSKVLAEGKLIAQADLDTADANARVADAQIVAAQGAVAQAQASLHSAKVNLAYTVIVSPIDGVVISRAVDVGQTVAASLSAPTLFTIAEDLTKMQVDTSVAEADVGKLTAGMKASFTVDAYPTDRFQGTVRQIRNAPQTVQNVVTYDAVVDVENPDLKLKPGMTATVAFTYAQRDGALRVTNAALRFVPLPGSFPSASAMSSAVPPPGSGAPAGGPSARLAAGAPDGGAVTPTAVASAAPGQAQAQPPPDPAPGGRGGRNRGAAAEGKRTVWVLRGVDPIPIPIRTGLSDGTLTEVLDGSDLHEGDLLVTDMVAGDAPKAPAAAAQQPPMRRMF